MSTLSINIFYIHYISIQPIFAVRNRSKRAKVYLSKINSYGFQLIDRERVISTVGLKKVSKKASRSLASLIQRTPRKKESGNFPTESLVRPTEPFEDIRPRCNVVGVR